MLHLEIDRTDIRTRRVAASEPAASAGAVLVRVDHFALTSNNVSYALTGDALDYWGFFPAPAGWGRLPVMGFGTVIESDVEGIAEGSRYFGFFPAGDLHLVEARPTQSGFIDAANHRDGHAMAYRAFDRADPGASDADEHHTVLLRGLFVTSYLCADFLADNHFFGADRILVTSASSKTSLALAHELRRIGGRHVVGLTSARNADFVGGTALYDEVIPYDDSIDGLDAATRSVIVDMAGDAALLGRLHERLGDSLAHSCRIGATHWEQAAGPAPASGPTPTFFFAPTQLAKRSGETGRDVFQSALDAALSGFIADARRWLTVSRGHGPDAMLAVYDDLVAGRVPPHLGHVVTVGESP